MLYSKAFFIHDLFILPCNKNVYKLKFNVYIYCDHKTLGIKGYNNNNEFINKYIETIDKCTNFIDKYTKFYR